MSKQEICHTTSCETICFLRYSFHSFKSRNKLQKVFLRNFQSTIKTTKYGIGAEVCEKKGSSLGKQEQMMGQEVDHPCRQSLDPSPLYPPHPISLSPFSLCWLLLLLLQGALSAILLKLKLEPPSWAWLPNLDLNVSKELPHTQPTSPLSHMPQNLQGLTWGAEAPYQPVRGSHLTAVSMILDHIRLHITCKKTIAVVCRY